MFIKNINLGLRSYITAWHFLSKHQLWYLAIWSGLINAVLVCGGLYLAIELSDSLTQFLFAWFGHTILESSWLYKIAWIALLIPTVALQLKLYKYLAIIVLSPLLGYAAEKVQFIIDNQIERKFTWNIFFKNIKRSMYISGRSFIIELLLTSACFILVFIPLLNVFMPIILILVESYFIGFAMLDYRHEYHQNSAQYSIEWSSKNKGITIGIGLGWFLLLLIPILGWVLAPILSVTAAGLASNSYEKPHRDG